MYPIPRPGRATTAVLAAALAVLVFPPASPAATLEPPRQIGTSDAQNPTLGIPRWKGYIHASDHDRMWVCFANDSSDGNNVVFTEDGGQTWSDNVINPSFNGYLDYHVGVAGKDGDVFFTFPGSEGIRVRRLQAPALSEDDFAPLVTLSGTGRRHRSNMMVDGGGRLWVFTRRSDDAGENVLYQYSDDDGATWNRGTVVETGTPNVRFGSMPYVDGRACVVVLNLQVDDGYEYYLWNGSAFEARSDYSIHAENVGYERAFTLNTVGGRDFHLVFGAGSELNHVWKDDNDPTSPWQRQVIERHDAMDPMDWSPILTTRGDELWLFYCRWDDDTAGSSQIYARRLVGAGGQWEEPALVSAGGLTHNVHPNTCFAVPPGCGYVPVFWMSGPNMDRVQFARLVGDGVPAVDDTPPATIKDLRISGQSGVDRVRLDWTAPGDDMDQGQAFGYDIRFSQTPITLSTWHEATPVLGEPAPAAPGTEQTYEVRDLVPGESYLFAIRTVDEVGNFSDVSNVPWIKVGDVSQVRDVPGTRPHFEPNRPNPFNPRTTIVFRLPVDGAARLTVHDAAGRVVARLLDETRPEGRHEVVWDGRDRHGRPAASGVYFSRLEFRGLVTTARMTLVR